VSIHAFKVEVLRGKTKLVFTKGADKKKKNTESEERMGAGGGTEKMQKLIYKKTKKCKKKKTAFGKQHMKGKSEGGGSGQKFNTN